VGGVAGTIPVLAQRAASEGPRWTRAVGIIPATPYYSDSSLWPWFGPRPVPGRRVCLGRLRAEGWNNRHGMDIQRDRITRSKNKKRGRRNSILHPL